MTEDKIFDPDFWKTYYEKGKISLKGELESNPEMFQRWVGSDKTYVLVSQRCLKKTYVEARVYSNSVEDLKFLWEDQLAKEYYDSTTQHFIADVKDQKIIEFLSVCM